MSVIVENKSDLNVTLTTVSGELSTLLYPFFSPPDVYSLGSFQNADTGSVLKNVGWFLYLEWLRTLNSRALVPDDCSAIPC